MNGILFAETEDKDFKVKIYLIEEEETEFAQGVVNENNEINVMLGMKGEFGDLIESLLHELEEGYNWINNVRLIDVNQPEDIQMETCRFEYNHDFFQKRCAVIGRLLADIIPQLQIAYEELNNDN